MVVVDGCRDEIEGRKDFRAAANGEDFGGIEEHTVDDGTNDLVNLSTGSSLGAGEPGEGRKAIELGGLEGTACDGGRSSKSSPPEGPGQTAVRKEKTGQRERKIIIINKKGSDKPLEHDDGVEERKGYRMETGEKMEEEERRGKGRVEVRLELGTRMWPA